MMKMIKRKLVHIGYMEVKEASDEMEMAKKELLQAMKKYRKAKSKYKKMYEIAMFNIASANDN